MKIQAVTETLTDGSETHDVVIDDGHSEIKMQCETAGRARMTACIIRAAVRAHTLEYVPYMSESDTGDMTNEQ